MITNIFEFYFSSHYYKDNDNRLLLRVKQAKLLNDVKSPNADERLKRALYSMALTRLDGMDSAIQPIAITFGNLYIKDNNRLEKAKIEIDNEREGNVYVAVIKDSTVVTLLLFPFDVKNEEIEKSIKAHDGTEIKQLISINGQLLNFNDSKRPATVIDLDVADSEFDRTWPSPKLRNNPWNRTSSGFSDAEISGFEKKSETDKFSMRHIDQSLISNVKDLTKEFSVSEGETILVPYEGGPKEKKIRKIVVDDKGNVKKYSLEFENTLKPLELKQGTKFIIAPKTKNDKYFKLLSLFDLKESDQLRFEGPISSISFYKKERFADNKPRLGIIIEPKFYF